LGAIDKSVRRVPWHDGAVAGHHVKRCVTDLGFESPFENEQHLFASCVLVAENSTLLARLDIHHRTLYGCAVF
jgi:hypothetical protein